MKKLLYLGLFLCIVMLSCNPETKNGNVSTRDGDYNIKIIDSCEYIEYDNGLFELRVYSLTHKGNCKHCLARNK